MPHAILCLFILLGALPAVAQKGRDWGVERTSYLDPLARTTVAELTGPEEKPNNLYYHFSNFTADNRFIIFAGQRTGAWQIYRLEVASGRIVQLTEGQGVAAHGACPHPKAPQILYYLRGPEVLELNIQTLAERRIGEIPPPRAGGYQQPTLSHDLKSLAVTKQRDERNWEIGLIDLATGAYRAVLTQGFRIGHVQHHPKLPLIFYVWETGGYAPQRTWLVDADGQANRPFFYETKPAEWKSPLKDWVTHEAWIPETGDMTLIVDKQAIAVAGADGKLKHWLPGDYWHVASRPDGKVLVADDNPGRLWLIETATGNRLLIASGLRSASRAVHAHASFDRAGRYILFNSGRTRETLALIDLASIPGAEWVKP
jgi:oligogalacturonide lyase